MLAMCDIWRAVYCAIMLAVWLAPVQAQIVMQQQQQQQQPGMQQQQQQAVRMPFFNK